MKIEDIEKDRIKLEELYDNAKHTLAYKFAKEYVPYLLELITDRTNDVIHQQKEIKQLKTIISYCSCEECGNELGSEWSYTDKFGLLCDECKIE
jgi:NAD-dependent SIR2 family protein deacetylase